MKIKICLAMVTLLFTYGAQASEVLTTYEGLIRNPTQMPESYWVRLSFTERLPAQIVTSRTERTCGMDVTGNRSECPVTGFNVNVGAVKLEVWELTEAGARLDHHASIAPFSLSHAEDGESVPLPSGPVTFLGAVMPSVSLSTAHFLTLSNLFGATEASPFVVNTEKNSADDTSQISSVELPATILPRWEITKDTFVAGYSGKTVLHQVKSR